MNSVDEYILQRIFSFIQFDDLVNVKLTCQRFNRTIGKIGVLDDIKQYAGEYCEYDALRVAIDNDSYMLVNYCCDHFNINANQSLMCFCQCDDNLKLFKFILEKTVMKHYFEQEELFRIFKYFGRGKIEIAKIILEKLHDVEQIKRCIECACKRKSSLAIMKLFYEIYDETITQKFNLDFCLNNACFANQIEMCNWFVIKGAKKCNACGKSVEEHNMW